MVASTVECECCRGFEYLNNCPLDPATSGMSPDAYNLIRSAQVLSISQSKDHPKATPLGILADLCLYLASEIEALKVQLAPVAAVSFPDDLSEAAYTKQCGCYLKATTREEWQAAIEDEATL